MKKIALFLMVMSIAVVGFAQPDVTTAYNLNMQMKFEEASTYIDKAINDPKAASKVKTWRYRGIIYYNIARDEALSVKYPKAAITSQESFFKSMELDPKGEYLEDTRANLNDLQLLVLNAANTAYGKGDFCSAADNFKSASTISDKFQLIDSTAIFNAAYCYDKCGKSAEAIAGYTKCGEIGYNVPVVFLYISDIHLRDNNKEESKRVLSAARAKYPKDTELLRGEVNQLLGEEEYAEAEQLLISLTENDPKNESVWFVLGVTYEKLKKTTEEVEAYKKSIALKPDYYDALFNLGAAYYNKGVAVLKECDKIPPREAAKYDDCVAKSKVDFGNAVSHLETAYNLKSTDKDVISALMEAYARMENMEGVKRMKDLLQK
jgi:tetratricopeptide (TPR) repeat protein